MIPLLRSPRQRFDWSRLVPKPMIGLGSGLLILSMLTEPGAAYSQSRGLADVTAQQLASLPKLTNGAQAWGDYDGDKLPDVLIMGKDAGGNNVTRLYHNTGSGFEDKSGLFPKGSFSLPQVANGAAGWGDYDHDGRLDLLVTGQTSDLKPTSLLYHNTPNGFQVQILWTAAIPAVAYGTVTWADFDGDDGPDDLFVTGQPLNDYSGYGVSYLLINIGTQFAHSNWLPDLPQVRNAAVVCTDFNQDKTPDLLLSGNTSASTRVSKLYLSSPRGYVDATNTIPSLSQFNPTALAVGDYTGNESHSLFMTGRNGQGKAISKLYNSRTAWSNFDEIKMSIPGVKRSRTGWADYDHDGRPDLMIAGILNDGSYFGKLYHNTKDNGFVDVTNILQTETFVDGAIAWGDYNKDTWPDLLYSGIAPNGSRWYHIFKNNQNSTFSEDCIWDKGCGVEQLEMPTAYGTATWVDFEHNGNQSLLFMGEYHEKTLTNDSYWSRKFYFVNKGSGKLIDTEETGIIHNPYGHGFPLMPDEFFALQDGATIWEDFNNDGLPDLLMMGRNKFQGDPPTTLRPATYLGQNMGGGKYMNMVTSKLQNVPSLVYGSAAWGDYDGDGWKDLILSGWDGNQNHTLLYRNNGGNNFTDESGRLPDLPQLAYSSVAWGDYDNDGRPDLILTGKDKDGKSVSKLYHNTKNGFIDVSTLLPGLVGVSTSAVNWIDYDNDGLLDLFISGDSESGPVSKLYRNKGISTVFDELSGLPQLTDGAAAFGDYDKDGRPDLMVTGKTDAGNAVSKLYHNMANGFEDSNLLQNQAGLTNGSVTWVDYDNDTWPDLMLTGMSGSEPVNALFHNVSTNLSDDPILKLQLVAPLHNCQTGAFTFQTTGGNGSLIEYSAPGITAWTTNPRQSVDEGLRQAADAQPITLVARQSGKEVRYVFDLRAVCPVDNPNRFRVVAPLYDCQTGAFTFQTAGGDGSGSPAAPIEYMAAGITAWTKNPNQLLDDGLRTSADVKPLELRARQGGNEVRYVWDIRAICPVEKPSLGLGSPQSQSFEDVSSLLSSLPAVQAPSLVWGDYDNDGKLDLMITGKADTPISKLYHNTGSGFEDQSGLLPGLPQVSSSSVAWTDYDNDGKLDLLLTGMTNTNAPVSKLYHNMGNGFEDQTNLIPGQPQVGNGSVAWGDYDRDGRVDFILTGRSTSGAFSKLYRNTGSGFEEKTSLLPSLPAVQLSAVAWGDYDNDGKLDLMLTGIIQSNTNPYVSKLYHNTGKGFEDVSTDQLPDLVGLAAGTAVWNDFDNDGNLDLLLTGTNGGTRYTTRLYRNTNYGFEDASRFAGFYLGSAAFGDYDNDGLKDLLITGVTTAGYSSKLYRNTGHGFADASDQLPGLPQMGYSAAGWADYDNDGKLDVLMTGYTSSGTVLKLYHNISPVVNTPPTSPGELISRTATTAVQLVWDLATDAQTPKAGLNYNLYVSDTPGGQNVVGPMADQKSGYRRVIQLGNSQTPAITLTGLQPNKTYYWSVQAIDGAFAGSAFAPEQRFTTSGQARTGVGHEPGVGLRAEVYPNPVESELTVRIDGVQDQSVNLQLMNLNGQPVQERKLNVIQPAHQERLSVAGLSSGLYLLRVSTDQQNVMLKVIKR